MARKRKSATGLFSELPPSDLDVLAVNQFFDRLQQMAKQAVETIGTQSVELIAKVFAGPEPVGFTERVTADLLAAFHVREMFQVQPDGGQATLLWRLGDLPWIPFNRIIDYVREIRHGLSPLVAGWMPTTLVDASGAVMLVAEVLICA